MSRIISICCALFAGMVCSTVVFAQKATPSSPAELTIISPAELTMVKKGVFKLNVGESMDLTDRGILLHFVWAVGDAGDMVDKIHVSINGTKSFSGVPIDGLGNGIVPVGFRWNLKQLPSTEAFVKDIPVCVLDNVSAVHPKGAPASAVFRLLCE